MCFFFDMVDSLVSALAVVAAANAAYAEAILYTFPITGNTKELLRKLQFCFI